MANNNFFKRSNKELLVNCTELKVYIPNSYFINEIAELVGSKVDTIGIFYFSIHGTENEDISKGVLHYLKLPSVITLAPKFMTKQRLKIKDNPEEIYSVLHFSMGDVFLESVEIIQSTLNTISFINLLHSGKLPTSIKYHEIIELYRENLTLNDVNLKVPSLVLEAIISELCRSKTNQNLPHRRDLERDFEFYPIKMLPHLNSTFASLSFEDPKKGLTLSIKRKRDGREQNISPVEKVIKY